MAQAEAVWPDEQMEQVVGNLLRIGVILAATVVFCGGILYLVRHGAAAADHQTFHGEPEDLCRPGGIIGNALAFRGRGLIQLGLLLLIATPVARVAFTAFAFARQKDWTYLVITLMVLSVLLFSLFYGQPEGGLERPARPPFSDGTSNRRG